MHRFAELLRFRYGVGNPSPEEAEWFLPLAHSIWEVRRVLAATVENSNEAEIQQRIQEDMHEFVVLWADLRVRNAAPGESSAVRRQVLELLDEAETLFGPSLFLDRCRQESARALGQTLAPALQSRAPSSAWEHYEWGRVDLRAGNLERAADEFQAGLEEHPEDFWLNFFQGLCAYRRGRFQQAVTAFAVCCALSPQTAECYYNRALAYQVLGESEAALKNYSRALRSTIISPTPH